MAQAAVDLHERAQPEALEMAVLDRDHLARMTFGDRGLWDGSLYVFDKRMNIEFSSEAKTLGVCVDCGTPTPRYRNRIDGDGRTLELLCESCSPDLEQD